MDITERIRETIDRRGPITFAEFMDVALYSPGGFYEHPPVGEHGHFVTSPHVHPVFGELLAIALEGLWSVMGERRPFRIVEVGAGDGTLAKQILAGLPGVEVVYTGVEQSLPARERLAALGLHTAEGLEEELVEPFVGCILANELLDNLPFRRVRGTPEGAVELRVGFEQDRFVDVEADCPKPVAQYCPPLGPGEEAVVHTGALTFIERIAGTLLEGYAILIDYGGGTSGEVHGYRNQRIVADVLGDPGSADITAGVDFTALAAHAKRLGLGVFGPVTQQEALDSLGFRRWAATERGRQTSLLAEGESKEAVKAWGDRNAAALLIDPAGLGRLRWLVLATPNLPRPPWTLPEGRPTL